MFAILACKRRDKFGGKRKVIKCYTDIVFDDPNFLSRLKILWISEFKTHFRNEKNHV